MKILLLGIVKQKKKNEYGVLEQSNMLDVENYLLETYDIFRKDLQDKDSFESKEKYITLFKKKKN